jgi:hypothetical protein
MMRKIAALVAAGLLLGGLLAAPVSAQEEPEYARIVLPRIIERPVVPPPDVPPPAVAPEVRPEPAIAVTGLDVTVGMVLAGLLVLAGAGTLLVARRRSRAAA